MKNTDPNMTNDYSKITRCLSPELSNERLQPLLALIAAGIPHLLWGYDALRCSNVSYPVSRKALQIVVRSADLEAASAAIINSGSSYNQSTRADLLAELWANRYYFESGCEFLYAPGHSGEYAPRWIVLIPEEVRYVSVTDDSCSELLAASPYFAVDKVKFRDARVATFLTLLNSMLKERTSWSSEDLIFDPKPHQASRLTGFLTVECDLWALFQFRTGFAVGHYTCLEDIPRKHIEVYESIDPENRPAFKRRFLEIKETAIRPSGENEAGQLSSKEERREGEDDAKRSMLGSGDARTSLRDGSLSESRAGPNLDNDVEAESERGDFPGNPFGAESLPVDSQSLKSSPSHSRTLSSGLGGTTRGSRREKGGEKKVGVLERAHSWIGEKIRSMKCFRKA